MENQVIENEIQIESQNNGEKTKSNKKIGKSLLLIGIAVVYFIIRVATSEKDFKDMYEELAVNSWCTIGADGSYMRLDTNPEDLDEEELFSYISENIEASAIIEEVNMDLGFPASLYEKMTSTTWSHGQQTESNKKYKVTWTFHPDKGLEVLYELN